MQRFLTFAIFCLLFSSGNVFGQLTIQLSSIPANTPPEDNIHIAGNFQGWDPADASSILTDNGNGVLEITISPAAGNLEFKFTRGSWAMVEGNENGGFLPNRMYNYSGNATTIQLDILSWEDLGGGGGSTAAANVSIIDESFFMPQLNRNRRIWLYVPPDYDSSQKDYPVLYMHDGQNVFDATTSFSGEWEVDESLNDLFANGDYGCIVVAIDNGGASRIDEYSPWVNPSFGGGEGDEYMEFIVNTLKPYIDANYRTLPDREYTGIMGSSMGGLISLYGGIEYQNVFSKVGSFSPSYWFSNESLEHVSNTGKEQNMRIYTIMGSGEGSQAVAAVMKMEDSLSAAGFGTDERNLTFHPDGQHSEWYWAREFSDAYIWLFGDLQFTSTSEISKPSFSFYPNPSSGHIRFEAEAFPADTQIVICSSLGQMVHNSLLSGPSLDISYLNEGFYTITLTSSNEIIAAKKLVLIK